MSASDYSVYIVRCADGSLYTGIAIDVARRIDEHERGRRGARYLRGRGPLKLEFTERVGDRGAATRIEHRLKRLAKPDKERLIAGERSLGNLLDGA
ncbi:MAG: GIY-YIG nuclease family protein [Woeseiaceae bacterium]